MPRYTLTDHEDGRKPVKDGGTAPAPTRGERRAAEAAGLAAKAAEVAAEGRRPKPGRATHRYAAPAAPATEKGK